MIALGALVACKGENGPEEPSIDVTGTLQAPANTELSALTVTVRGEDGPAVGQLVTFEVIEGGGTIAATSATTGANGTVTVPAWKLGKLDVPQVLRVTAGSLTKNVTATIATDYDIVIRYYGTQPSDAQRALFENAAARIRATVTGDLIGVLARESNGSALDISGCTPGQTTTINETIDDVVIYVRLFFIDGPGKALASAGPCFVRSGKEFGSGVDSMTTVIGLMQFDTADLPILREETILHEMLHVLGMGALWGPPPDGWGLVEGENTPNPRYIGPEGRLGCQQVGGTVTCATSVPVEDTLPGGTGGVHWEENVFDNELMTGFVEISSTPMPFSLLSVRSLRDIGYTVNVANFDNYTKPFGALRVEGPVEAEMRGWEFPSPVPIRTINQSGRIGRQLLPR